MDVAGQFQQLFGSLLVVGLGLIEKSFELANSCLQGLHSFPGRQMGQFDAMTVLSLVIQSMRGENGCLLLQRLIRPLFLSFQGMKRGLSLQRILIISEQLLNEKHPLVDVGMLLMQLLLRKFMLFLQASLDHSCPFLHLIFNFLSFPHDPSETQRTMLFGLMLPLFFLGMVDMFKQLLMEQAFLVFLAMMFASFMGVFSIMVGMMFFSLVARVRRGGAFLCGSVLDLFFEFLAGCGNQLCRIQRSHGVCKQIYAIYQEIISSNVCFW